MFVNVTSRLAKGLEAFELNEMIWTGICSTSFRTILVQMMSAAGTGFSLNAKRGRLREKMVLRKHDPIGEH